MPKTNRFGERIRWVLTLGIVITGSALLYWGIRPLSQTTKQLPIYLEDLTIPSEELGGSASNDTENYLVGFVTLSLPARLRVGDAAPLRANIKVADLEEPAQNPLLVLMQIDTPDVQVEPPGEIVQPLVAGFAPGYEWWVHADQEGVWRAVISVEFRQIDSQTNAHSQWVVVALPIELQAESLFGLSGKASRWIGAGGLALGLSLAIMMPRRKRYKHASKKR